MSTEKMPAAMDREAVRIASSTWKVFRFNAHLWVAIGATALSVVLLLAGLLPGQPGYRFPNLVAVILLVLGVLMVLNEPVAQRVRRIAGIVELSEIQPVPWKELAPAFVMLVAYLGLAEVVGFYVMSALTFLVMGTWYGASRRVGVTARTCMPVSMSFVAVLYAVFMLLLNVQTPRGLLF